MRFFHFLPKLISLLALPAGDEEKFIAENVVEIGKRLIAAKEMVEHGEWANWLKSNFNLGQRTADRFMEIYRRFSNSSPTTNFDISTFNQTQLMELLALPAGDEEKFIAENVVEIGKRLIQAKEMVEHGQWQDWLDFFII